MRQGGARERHTPGLEDADPVAQRERFVHVVCDEDYRLAQMPANALELGPELLPCDAVECAKRFVHQKDRRIDRERTSDADALPMEHEEEHRQLLEKLIEGGLIAASEAGRVRLEREPAGAAPREAPAAAQVEREVVSQGA